jgi:hypothetical protein
MSEQSMSRLVMEALRPLDPVRVENLVHPGTPDINFNHGWIELKEVVAWPSKPWHLRIPHFTIQQKIWLRRRVKHGGRAYLLLKVASEWLLFSGERAADLIGESTPEQLREGAEMTWRTGEVGCWKRLLEHLQRA